MSKKTELNTLEKVAMCGVVILGRDVLPVAYAMSHPRATTQSEESLKVMRSRWYASDLCKAFRADMAAKLARIAVDDGRGHDLTTREGVLGELITSVKAATGKDAISGLQSLAKMQGFGSMESSRPQVINHKGRCLDCPHMLCRVFNCKTEHWAGWCMITRKAVNGSDLCNHKPREPTQLQIPFC